MAVKPTKFPRWATDDLTDPVSAQANVVEPSEAQKDSGFLRNDTPPRQYENWIKRLAYEWFLWLEEKVENLLARMTATEIATTSNQSQITANDGELADHESRISGIETPPAVSGFTPGRIFYIDDFGDSQGGNTFDFSVIPDNTFESIGPTGSVADNIWTALDLVSANAAYVIVEIQYACGAIHAAGTSNIFNVNAIKTGGTRTPVDGNVKAFASTVSVQGTYTTAIYGQNLAVIPIDASRRFDLRPRLVAGTCSKTLLKLVGFGI